MRIEMKEIRESAYSFSNKSTGKLLSRRMFDLGPDEAYRIGNLANEERKEDPDNFNLNEFIANECLVEIKTEDPSGKEPKSVKYPEVSVELIGQDGNAFFIITRTSNALKFAGVPQEEVTAFQKEAQSGDYKNVLSTVTKWVNVF